MSKPVLFKDLRKRSGDLLTKDFPGDKSEKKLEYKGTTSSGVGFETLFVQDDKGGVTGTVKPKLTYKAYNAEVNGEFTTKSDAKVEVSVSDQLAKGLKTITSANKKKDEVFGAFGVEYKSDVVALNATADIGKKAGPTVALGTVFGKDGFSLGVNATYLVSKSSLEGVELVGSYRNSEFDVSAFGRLKPDDKSKKDTQEVGFAFYHDASSDLAFGAEGQYNLASSQVDLSAGLQYKATSDTTFKGKFTNAGNLGVSFQQQLNPRTKFTLSSAFDLVAIQSGRSGASFGFGVNFS